MNWKPTAGWEADRFCNTNLSKKSGQSITSCHPAINHRFSDIWFSAKIFKFKSASKA
jgi:hypothetical protein